FRSVKEDEEDVLGPITIMSEIKDVVQDEKLQGRMVIYIVSNKKEMEPAAAAAACASMAALAAASLAVIDSACASN
ncbi:hypothetical protein Tco_1536112, partial [Tanacetum coccineum]